MCTCPSTQSTLRTSHLCSAIGRSTLFSSCLARWLYTGPRSVSSPTRQSFKTIPLCSSLVPRSLAPASHFFHPSAIEDCLHHLGSNGPPCPAVAVLSQTRRAAPVFKRHRLGICCGHACTKASKLPILGVLLGVLDRRCRSRTMDQS